MVWVDRRFPLLLRFCCHNFGRSRFLRILVDDQEFQLPRQEGANPIEIGPLAPRAQLGPTEIRIQPEVMFQPGGPDGPDKRVLGTTFLWLELAPVE